MNRAVFLAVALTALAALAAATTACSGDEGRVKPVTFDASVDAPADGAKGETSADAPPADASVKDAEKADH